MADSVQVRCLRGIRRQGRDWPMGTVLDVSAAELAAAPHLYQRVTEICDPVAEQAAARTAAMDRELRWKQQEAERERERREARMQRELQTLLIESERAAAQEAAAADVRRRTAAHKQARGEA